MNSERGEARLRIAFSENLEFFLSRGQENPAEYDLVRRASIKDIIESLGVPHTEVGRIRFEGKDRGFEFVPELSGLVQVSGVESPCDPLSGSRFRPEGLSRIRFLADLNVIKLGRYLLLLGYDTLLARELSDGEIADRSEAEERIVLTRDTRLLFRKKIRFARRIRSVAPGDQLMETIRFFGLAPDPGCFFSRCAGCNLRLEGVEKADIMHLLEPRTKTYVHEFRRCPGCGQIFWEGSHYRALKTKFSLWGILE